MMGAAESPARTVGEVLAESQVESVLDELDCDLVGLAPVKGVSATLPRCW